MKDNSDKNEYSELKILTNITTTTGLTDGKYSPASDMFEIIYKYQVDHEFYHPIYTADMESLIQGPLITFKEDLMNVKENPEQFSKYCSKFFSSIQKQIFTKKEPYSYYSNWTSLINKIINKFEEETNLTLHKGAHNYWTGCSLIDLNYLDRGFFYLFNAFEEDNRLLRICLKKNPSIIPKLDNLPSFKLMQAKINTQDPLFSAVSRWNEIWIKRISYYNKKFGGSLNEGLIRRKILENDLFREQIIFFLHLMAQIDELDSFQRYNLSDNLIFSSKILDLFFQMGRFIENILRKIGENYLNDLRGTPDYATQRNRWSEQVLKGFMDVLVRDLRNNPISVRFTRAKVAELNTWSHGSNFKNNFKFENIDPRTPESTYRKLEKIVTFNISGISHLETYLSVALSTLRNFPGHWITSINCSKLVKEIVDFVIFEWFLVIEMCIEINLL